MAWELAGWVRERNVACSQGASQSGTHTSLPLWPGLGAQRALTPLCTLAVCKPDYVCTGGCPSFFSFSRDKERPQWTLAAHSPPRDLCGPQGGRGRFKRRGQDALAPPPRLTPDSRLRQPLFSFLPVFSPGDPGSGSRRPRRGRKAEAEREAEPGELLS